MVKNKFTINRAYKKRRIIYCFLKSVCISYINVHKIYTSQEKYTHTLFNTLKNK